MFFKKKSFTFILMILFIASLTLACSPTDKIQVNQVERIGSYMEEISRETFEPYYELLDFIVTDYKEESKDKTTEAFFLYTIIYKNYDRDPDTIDYIREAKETGNPHYQQFYDEYLLPQEMNFDFKVVIDQEDEITLYHNPSPKGVEWQEIEMEDFISK